MPLPIPQPDQTQSEFIVVPFEIKSIKEHHDEEGVRTKVEFEGYAAAFNNIDFGGDVILSGAFVDNLIETGGVVPIQLDHSMNVKDNAGFGLSAAEDAHGLLIRGQLNLLKQAGRDALTTMEHAKAVGAPLGLSIGYRTQDFEDIPETGIRLLKKLAMHEYSVTLFPMNTRALVTSIKSAIESKDPEQIGIKKFQIKTVLAKCGCDVDQTIRALDTLFPTFEEELPEKITEEIEAGAKKKEDEESVKMLSDFGEAMKQVLERG
jgi:HK97 family phage prohead protease